MILYEPKRLLFAHLPHTGGTFVEQILYDLGAERISDQHTPTWQMGAALRERYTVVGLHRHPVPWYRSCYAFAQRVLRGEVVAEHISRPAIALSMALYGRGSADRREVIYGMTHRAEVAGLPPLLGLATCSVYPNAAMLAPGGLWTWFVHWYYGGIEIDGRQTRPPDVWLRQSHLNADLAALLGVDVRHLDMRPRTNPSPAPPLTDEERAWVWEADGPIASAWGYA